MLTARHVISSRREPIEVYFESDNPLPGVHGGRILDDATTLSYFHDRSYPYLTKFSVEQESPFLQNRLYQLGLENVSQAARVRLRGPWHFVVEDENFDALSNSNHILDVALLRAQRRDFEFSTHPDSDSPELKISTGGFPLRAPGVFFDYIPFRASLILRCPEERNPDGSCPVEEELEHTALPAPVGPDSHLPTPLWMLHNNVFPGEPDEFGGYPLTVNLVSNPYPYVSTGDLIDPEKGVRHIVDGEQLTHIPGFSMCSSSGGVETFIAGDLILASLDGFARSSGGALFHSLRSLRPYGVAQHRTALAPTGVTTDLYGPRSEVLRTGWREPVGTRLDNLVAFSMVSPFVAAVTRWDDADDNENTPGAPIPVQPPDDPVPPDCVTYDTEHNCIEFASSLATSTVFPNAPAGLVPFVMPGSQASDAEGFPDSDRTESDDERKNPSRLVQCGVSHVPFGDISKVRTTAGLGVGFIGSLQYNPDNATPTADEGSVVGTLRMICTPWASVPFVENWMFLQTIGTSSRNTGPNTALVPNSFGTLAHSLATIAEWRHDPNEPESAYLRPLSMKTCPPNYFLRGVDFHVRPHPDDAGQAILAGITRLRCHRSRRPYRQQVTIPEEVIVDLYDPADSCSMYLGFDCFSLGQHIGWSRPPSVPQCQDENDTHCTDHIQCEGSREAVSGFYYHRSADGFISEFALDCMRAPI